MSDPDGGRFAIVGAGIGGLAAAIALSRAGVAPTLFERRSTTPRGGGGLWLFGNALAALRALGLEQDVCEHATTVGRYLVCTWSGDLLWRLPLESLATAPDRPALMMIGREDLLSVLQRATEPRWLRSGSTCSGFAELDRGVRPLFFGGTGHDSGLGVFDGLIGADGFHSVIRSQLLGPERAHHTGVAWFGQAKTTAGEWPYRSGDSVTLLGPGQAMTAGTLAGRSHEPAAVRRVFWFASERGPVAGRPIQDLDDAARRFHPTVVALMRASPKVACFPIRDRNPRAVWGRRRVTLLGDAAHPMTPDVSQGAGQALESACDLACCLRADRDIEECLRAYERRRMHRTATITRWSRALSALTRLPVPDAVRKMGRAVGLMASAGAYRHLLNPGLGSKYRLLG